MLALMDDKERLKLLQACLLARAENKTPIAYGELASNLGLPPYSEAFRDFLYWQCRIDKANDKPLLTSLVVYSGREKEVGNGFWRKAFPDRYDIPPPSDHQLKSLLHEEQQKVYRQYKRKRPKPSKS